MSYAMKKLFCLIFSIILLFISPASAFGQSLDEQLAQLENQINDLVHQKQLSENATKPLESELASDQTQIADLRNKIGTINNQLAVKQQELNLLQKNIAIKEDDLNLQNAEFIQQVRLLYIRDQTQLPLTMVLGTDNANDFSYGITLESSITRQNMEAITSISGKLKSLAQDKAKAQQEKQQLAQAQDRLAKDKAAVDDRANFLQGQITEAKKFQSDLSAKIADLTSKQQSILAAKSGTFVTSVGDVPLPDDPNASPAFNPGFSPAFAGFSFGAFTHGKGMSQYGAKGRASQGQNYNQILQAYYQKGTTSVDTGGSINVSGYGSMDFEGKYLMGIAEMPSSFPGEALKAQAVAARSYAYRYKQNGQSICTDESCQVYSDDKANNPPQAWKDAVNATKGQIIQDVVTYYSSTTGGYVSPLGWDTTSNSKDTWTAGAYEKIAGSPWFYKGWYTQSYSASSANCGHSNPWLTQEEMSDILNTYLVQNKGGVDTGRITPVTTSCWGGNPYSMGEMRDLANNVGGGAVTSISGVSVVYSNSGVTSSVTFSTNRGSITISGDTFKQTFNLRAPGYISLKSNLYNIEKK